MIRATAAGESLRDTSYNNRTLRVQLKNNICRSRVNSNERSSKLLQYTPYGRSYLSTFVIHTVSGSASVCVSRVVAVQKNLAV